MVTVNRLIRYRFAYLYAFDRGVGYGYRASNHDRYATRRTNRNVCKRLARRLARWYRAESRWSSKFATFSAIEFPRTGNSICNSSRWYHRHVSCIQRGIPIGCKRFDIVSLPTSTIDK